MRMESCEFTDTTYALDLRADSLWVRDLLIEVSPGPQSRDSITGQQYLKVDQLELVDYAPGMVLRANHLMADSLRLVQRVERMPAGILCSGTGTDPRAHVSNVELDYSAVFSGGPEASRLLWFAGWSDLSASNAMIRPPAGGVGTMALSLERVQSGLVRNARVIGGRSTVDGWTPIAVQSYQSNVALEQLLVADHGGPEWSYLGLLVHTSSVRLVGTTIADIRGAEAVGLYDGQLTMDRVVVSNPECGVPVTCAGTSSVDATATDVIGHSGGNWIGCLEGLESRDGNFSADPLFCTADPDAYTLAANSPCAVGNHPTGVDWGVIGFGDVGCAAVSATRKSVGIFKSRYQERQ